MKKSFYILSVFFLTILFFSCDHGQTQNATQATEKVPDKTQKVRKKAKKENKKAPAETIMGRLEKKRNCIRR